MKITVPTRIILAAVAYTIIVQVLSVLSVYSTMNYYTDPAYSSVWSKIMMPGPGPPPAEFFYYSIAFSFITGLIYSFAYSRIRKIFENKGALQKGLRYGFGLFLVTGIPSFLIMYLLLNLPFGLLLFWLLFDSLIVNLIIGAAISRIIG